MPKDTTVKCGACKKVFLSDKEYLKHTCITGFTPTDVEHFDKLSGGRFSKVSASAIKRGEAKK